MNRFILVSLLAFTLGSFLTHAKTVNLHLSHVAGTEEFTFDTGVYENAENLAFKITRLEYYISEIQLVHDGGQITDLEGVFLLINPNQESYELGDFELVNLEAINFHIGVPETENHADPSAWDADHPLAPKDPSMHWGWASGYRFVAIEGFSDPENDGNLNSLFQFHAVSDEYYTDLSLENTVNTDTEVLDIPFEVDILKMLEGVNLVNNIVHGTGNDNRQILINMEIKDVFEAVVLDPDVPQALTDFSAESSFSFYPNPAHISVQVPYYFPNQQQIQFCLMDITGRIIFEENLLQSKGLLTISQELDNGMYFGGFYNKEGLLARRKLVVLK